MTIVIAHRGASQAAPENTLSAVKKAIEVGAHGIEIDVHLSKDGHVIVCHDATLDRTTNGAGYIKNHTLRQIKQLDAGSWFGAEFRGEPVPTLGEVLRMIRGTGILLNVELKTQVIEYPGLEKRVLKLVTVFDYLPKTIISSFNPQSLAIVKDLNPHASVGYLYGSRAARPWSTVKSIGADYLLPNYRRVNMWMMMLATRRNLKVIPYTVNSVSNMKRLITFGVYGLITDRPGQAVEILNRFKRRSK